MREHSVVITGLGLCCSMGSSKAEVLAALRDKSFEPLSRIELFDARDYKAQHIAHVRGHDPSTFLSPRQIQSTTRCDRFAHHALAQALQESTLSPKDYRNAPLFVGASSGGMLEMENARLQKPESVPKEYWKYPVWGSARYLARRFKLGNAVSTYMTACSSAAHALGQAMLSIRSGKAERALAGGCESLSRMTLSGFGSLGILDPAGTRPFSESRAGISLGEGAAFFVLESEASAQARGAKIIAYLSGYGAASDGHHMVHPKENGEGAALAMHRAIHSAGIRPQDIDFINAHGTGTQQNDAMEVRAISEIFKELEASAKLCSLKGHLGHTLGAGAAIELAVNLIAQDAEILPATRALRDSISTPAQVELLCENQRGRAQHILSSSFAFGGNNAALICTAPEAQKVRSEASSAAPTRFFLSQAFVASSQGHSGTATGIVALHNTNTEPELNFKARDIISPRALRRQDPLSSATTAVGEILCKDLSDEERKELSFYFGTSFGAFDASINYLKRLFSKGPALVSPLEFPNLVHNAPSGYASIHLKSQGPNLTSCQQDLAGMGAFLAALRDAQNTPHQALVIAGDLHAEALGNAHQQLAQLQGHSTKTRSVLAGLRLSCSPQCNGIGAWAEIVLAEDYGHQSRDAVIQKLQQALGKKTIDTLFWLGPKALPKSFESLNIPKVLALREHYLGDGHGLSLAGIAIAAAYLQNGPDERVLVAGINKAQRGFVTLLARPEKNTPKQS